MKKELYARKTVNKTITADIVIVGGGLSGVCCALSAARKDKKVILVQDRPVLGGNASSEIRVWALGATSHMGNNNRWAREGGIIDEIMVENLYKNKEGNPVIFDSLLLDKVLCEPNILLFLNTVVYNVNTDISSSNTSVISSVDAFNSQNQVYYNFKAEIFCDASGDGIVGFLAGASHEMGAEGSDIYNEGFSPSEEYGRLLGHTIFMYTKKTEEPVEYIAPEFALKDISLIPKINQVSPEKSGCNYWWFEYGGELDTITDSEEIKKELWKVVYGVWNYIKNSGKYPEAKNYTLEWVGVIPGKRESRRFKGLYTLTQHDIVNQTIFDDAVAYGGWAIDLHPAKGVYSSLPSCNQYHSKGIYGIPYRCYVSSDINNLFFLGRLISASHVAFGSTRVMITSAFGGQAIGVAASLCIDKQCSPSELLSNNGIYELQSILNKDGQSIPHQSIKHSNEISNAKLSSSSTLVLDSIPFNGNWMRLDFSRGMLMPLKKDKAYTFVFDVWAENQTELQIDLIASTKPFNYTPDLLIDSIIRISYSLVINTLCL